MHKNCLSSTLQRRSGFVVRNSKLPYTVALFWYKVELMIVLCSKFAVTPALNLAVTIAVQE